MLKDAKKGDKIYCPVGGQYKTVLEVVELGGKHPRKVYRLSRSDEPKKDNGWWTVEEMEERGFKFPAPTQAKTKTFHVRLEINRGTDSLDDLISELYKML